MLGVGNSQLTVPRYNEHFACFPKNSLNRGFQYNERISPVPLHFVKLRFLRKMIYKMLITSGRSPRYKCISRYNHSLICRPDIERGFSLPFLGKMN